MSRARFCLLGGREGIFDLEDILQILRDERMRDICVIEIPPEQQYVHYLMFDVPLCGGGESDYLKYVGT